MINFLSKWEVDYTFLNLFRPEKYTKYITQYIWTRQPSIVSITPVTAQKELVAQSIKRNLMYFFVMVISKTLLRMLCACISRHTKKE